MRHSPACHAHAGRTDCGSTARLSGSASCIVGVCCAQPRPGPTTSFSCARRLLAVPFRAASRALHHPSLWRTSSGPPSFSASSQPDGAASGGSGRHDATGTSAISSLSSNSTRAVPSRFTLLTTPEYHEPTAPSAGASTLAPAFIV